MYFSSTPSTHTSSDPSTSLASSTNVVPPPHEKTIHLDSNPVFELGDTGVVSSTPSQPPLYESAAGIQGAASTEHRESGAAPYEVSPILPSPETREGNGRWSSRVDAYGRPFWEMS